MSRAGQRPFTRGLDDANVAPGATFPDQGATIRILVRFPLGGDSCKPWSIGTRREGFT